MNIQHYIAEKGSLVEEHLDTLLRSPALPPSLQSSSRYATLGSGKRIRPILALATCEVIKGEHHNALVPACALEMIHAYSLIHDDLPCMDNDDFRRGKPTVHKQFNEGHAVLTGDYLLTFAFELLTTAPGLSPDQKIKLVEILSKRSGGLGMVAGQVLDIEGEGQDLSLKNLQEIHSKKTGAMILASVEFGAVCAGVTEMQMDCLQTYAKELGIAFQITDDILDVTSGSHKRGPQTPSDIKNGKTTYVTLLGLDAAQKTAKVHENAAIEALKGLGRNGKLLEEIARLILQRSK